MLGKKLSTSSRISITKRMNASKERDWGVGVCVCMRRPEQTPGQTYAVEVKRAHTR